MPSAAVAKRASATESEFWTAKEVAEHIKMTRDWVYRNAPNIPTAHQMGKTWRFESAAVRAWYEEQRHPKGKA